MQAADVLTAYGIIGCGLKLNGFLEYGIPGFSSTQRVGDGVTILPVIRTVGVTPVESISARFSAVWLRQAAEYGRYISNILKG